MESSNLCILSIIFIGPCLAFIFVSFGALVPIHYKLFFIKNGIHMHLLLCFRCWCFCRFLSFEGFTFYLVDIFNISCCWSWVVLYVRTLRFSIALKRAQDHQNRSSYEKVMFVSISCVGLSLGTPCTRGPRAVHTGSTEKLTVCPMHTGSQGRAHGVYWEKWL